MRANCTLSSRSSFPVDVSTEMDQGFEFSSTAGVDSALHSLNADINNSANELHVAELAAKIDKYQLLSRHRQNVVNLASALAVASPRTPQVCHFTLSVSTRLNPEIQASCGTSLRISQKCFVIYEVSGRRHMALCNRAWHTKCSNNDFTCCTWSTAM